MNVADESTPVSRAKSRSARPRETPAPRLAPLSALPRRAAAACLVLGNSCDAINPMLATGSVPTPASGSGFPVEFHPSETIGSGRERSCAGLCRAASYFFCAASTSGFRRKASLTRSRKSRRCSTVCAIARSGNAIRSAQGAAAFAAKTKNPNPPSRVVRDFIRRAVTRTIASFFSCGTGLLTCVLPGQRKG